jgi:Cu-Zn family superoxide dismutase
VKTITASLVGPDGASLGNVQLSQDANGVVQVIVDTSQLPAGPHGIHVHTTGACQGPAFTSAGGHFNPAARVHGLDNAAGPHAGDLPEIDADSVGQLEYTATTDRISLTGGAKNIFDVDGAALIIHASADDQVTDPTGNSGTRIACAVLAAPNPALATPKPPATGSGTMTGDSSPTLLIAGAAALLVIGCAMAGAFAVKKR